MSAVRPPATTPLVTPTSAPAVAGPSAALSRTPATVATTSAVSVLTSATVTPQTSPAASSPLTSSPSSTTRDTKSITVGTVASAAPTIPNASPSNSPSSSSSFPIAAIAGIAAAGGLVALLVLWRLCTRARRKRRPPPPPPLDVAFTSRGGGMSERSPTDQPLIFDDPYSSRKNSMHFAGAAARSASYTPPPTAGGGFFAPAPSGSAHGSVANGGDPNASGASLPLSVHPLLDRTLDHSTISTNTLRDSRRNSRYSAAVASHRGSAYFGNGAGGAGEFGALPPLGPGPGQPAGYHSAVAGGGRPSYGPRPKSAVSTSGVSGGHGGGGGVRDPRQSSNRRSYAPHNPHSRVEITLPSPLGPPPGAVVAADRTTLQFSSLSGIGDGAWGEGSSSGAADGEAPPQEDWFGPGGAQSVGTVGPRADPLPPPPHRAESQDDRYAAGDGLNGRCYRQDSGGSSAPSRPRTASASGPSDRWPLSGPESGSGSGSGSGLGLGVASATASASSSSQGHGRRPHGREGAFTGDRPEGSGSDVEDQASDGRGGYYLHHHHQRRASRSEDREELGDRHEYGYGHENGNGEGRGEVTRVPNPRSPLEALTRQLQIEALKGKRPEAAANGGG